MSRKLNRIGQNINQTKQRKKRKESVTRAQILAVEALLREINAKVQVAGHAVGVDNEEEDGHLASAYLLIRTLLNSPPGSPVTLQTPTKFILGSDKRREKTIVAQLPQFVEILSAVDLSRVQWCIACNKLFYAKHRRKQVCSKTCGTRIRVAKSRQLHKENAVRYELNRANAEAQKEHKNGTV